MLATLRLVVLLTESTVPVPACTEHVRVPDTVQSTTSVYSVLGRMLDEGMSIQL